MTDNLIPLDKRTKDEQREIQTLGGIKSGEVRRARKSMREKLLLLLSLPSEIRDGLDKETSGLIAMIEKWEKTGDKNTGDFIRDTIGEKPTEKTEIVGEIPPLVIRELKNDNGNSNSVSSTDKQEIQE